MLSNKLTFSLASLVVLIALALIATPVMAQTTKPTATITAVDLTEIRRPTVAADSTATPAVPEFNPEIEFKVEFSEAVDMSGSSDGPEIFSPADIMLYAIDAMGTAGTTELKSSLTLTVTVTADPDHIDTIGTAGTAPARARVFKVTATFASVPSSGTHVPIIGPSNRGIRVKIPSSASEGVTVAIGPNATQVNDDIIQDFTNLPPVLGTTTVKVAGPNTLTDPFMVTLTFSAAPNPAPMMSDIMVEPRGVTVGSPTVDPADSMKYTVALSNIPFGTDSVKVSLPTSYVKGGGMVMVPPVATTVTPTEGVTTLGPFSMPAPASRRFLVIQQTPPTGGNGINAAALDNAPVTNATLPDLHEFFGIGGTLEVAVPTPAGTTPAQQSVVITEIMWGLDVRATNKQWIEVYNNTAGAVMFYLVFTPDRDVANTTVGMAMDTVVDRVSTLHLAKWALPGQSGNTDPATNPSTGITPAPVNLISAYRNADVNAAKDGYTAVPMSFSLGVYADSWKKSEHRRNLTGPYIGSPGTVHQGAPIAAATAVPSDSVVFNEVRNATTNSYDFIELYNSGSSGVNLKDWEISIIRAGASPVAASDVDLIDLFSGDYTLGSKEILLIIPVNPRGDSIDFNEGVDQDVNAADRVERGAQHKFIVRDFALPNNSGFMLVLRNHQGKNGEAVHIQDLAGYVAIADTGFNTEVWPLKGWRQPKDADNRFTGDDGDSTFSGTTVWNRKDYGSKAWWHQDAWAAVGNEGGIGYRREAPASNAIGTPGYARDARKGKKADYDAADANAEITISEIMYDDGPRGNTAQWIELYNSSFTNTVNLKDWYLEVVNHEAADAYVDEKIQFKTDLTILPNQTALIVSGNGVNNVAEKYVYSLFQHHRRDLSLTTRKSTLLSPEGFHITLSDKDDVMVDTAGNLKSNRNLAVDWELPMLDGRQSIVRIYGTQTGDGDKMPDFAETGTMASSWAVSSVGGLSYYGDRGDMGTPGYRDGGPLPVSLSSFRPMRDKATGAVVIRWITQSELNNAGFNILRSETKSGEFKVVNTKGIIPGHGTTSEKHVYTWTDTSAKPNVVYYYQIEDVSLDGDRTTLRTTHLRGNVNAAGKLTTIWGDLKTQN